MIADHGDVGIIGVDSTVRLSAALFPYWVQVDADAALLRRTSINNYCMFLQL